MECVIICFEKKMHGKVIFIGNCLRKDHFDSGGEYIWELIIDTQERRRQMCHILFNVSNVGRRAVP